MNPTQHALLGYAISFALLGGFSLWCWIEYRRLSSFVRQRSQS